MESTDLELLRFTKKASSYRKALSNAPNSRILEIAPIISIIEGYIKSNELEKQNLVIVDLMSGSGYLTNYLKKSGFKKIHAIEACNEMSASSNYYNGVQLHPISNIKETNKILKEIKPNIIVSLASFHHLIVRNPDNTINEDESIDLQTEISTFCVKHLEKEGLILIADIFDDNLLNIVDSYPDSKYWAKNETKKLIQSTFIHKDIQTKLNNSKTLDEYSDHLKNIIPNLQNQKNPTTNWFRKVVNTKTTLGHDDIAISKKLIEKLSTKFNITCDTFYCPWVFENENQFENFLWNKFGFINNETELIKLQEVKDLAKTEAGVGQFQDKEIYFGWALSILTIRDKTSKETNYVKRQIGAQLLLLIGILIVYGVAKKYFYYESEMWDKLIFIIVGVLLKTAFDVLTPILWKK